MSQNPYSAPDSEGGTPSDSHEREDDVSTSDTGERPAAASTGSSTAPDGQSADQPQSHYAPPNTSDAPSSSGSGSEAAGPYGSSSDRCGQASSGSYGQGSYDQSSSSYGQGSPGQGSYGRQQPPGYPPTAQSGQSA